MEELKDFQGKLLTDFRVRTNSQTKYFPLLDDNVVIVMRYFLRRENVIAYRRARELSTTYIYDRTFKKDIYFLEIEKILELSGEPGNIITEKKLSVSGDKKTESFYLGLRV